MKKIYLKPFAEFDEIEEDLLYAPSVTKEKTDKNNPSTPITTGEDLGDEEGKEGGWDL